MTVSWSDRDYDDRQENRHRERLERCGLLDPHMTERDQDHQFALDDADRRAEKAPLSSMHLAYTERPAPRERRAHFDETRVRALLHPRSGQVQVQPRDARDAA